MKLNINAFRVGNLGIRTPNVLRNREGILGIIMGEDMKGINRGLLKWEEIILGICLEIVLIVEEWVIGQMNVLVKEKLREEEGMGDMGEMLSLIHI